MDLTWMTCGSEADAVSESWACCVNIRLTGNNEEGSLIWRSVWGEWSSLLDCLRLVLCSGGLSVENSTAYWWDIDRPEELVWGSDGLNGKFPGVVKNGLICWSENCKGEKASFKWGNTHEKVQLPWQEVKPFYLYSNCSFPGFWGKMHVL